MEDQKEKLSAIDTAYLRMESPTNLMMTGSSMIFKNRLDFDAVKNTVMSKFLNYSRFQKSIVEDGGDYYWKDDPYFDIVRHLHRVALPEPAGTKELEDFISNLMSLPLNHFKPLWEIHFIENYREGSAILFRVHHSYADGMGLIHVLMNMTEIEPIQSIPHIPSQLVVSKADPESKISRYFVKGSLDLGKKLLKKSHKLVTEPTAFMQYAEKGVRFVSDAALTMFSPSDQKTLFQGKQSARKQVVWGNPFPLSELKEVSKNLDCSVNDILFSVVAGSLRRYLMKKGERVDGVKIRATVPVHLRTIDEAKHLSNKFGFSLINLPIGIDSPLERLTKIHVAMNNLNSSYQPNLSFGLMNFLGTVPKLVQKNIVNQLSKKASSTISNIPGPSHPLFFAGKEITEFVYWVAQTGHLGLGISLLSYNHQISVGVIADPNLIQNPSVITDGLTIHFEELKDILKKQ